MTETNFKRKRDKGMKQKTTNQQKLHELIEIAKNMEDDIEFAARYDSNLPEEFIPLAYTMWHRYEFDSLKCMDTIWYYAHNQSFHTLLEFFGGSAENFAITFQIAYETVHKWETGEETAPPDELERILSEMLSCITSDYHRRKDIFEDYYAAVYDVCCEDGEYDESELY